MSTLFFAGLKNISFKLFLIFFIFAYNSIIANFYLV
jgi:hypothetical protein